MQKNPSEKNILKSSGIISLSTFLSRILGFLRDVVIASLFGTGLAADSFFITFRIPNILRKLMAEGILSAGFVPEFVALLAQEKNDEANKLASLLINLISLGSFIVVIPGIIWARGLLRLLAPGFSGSEIELAVQLMRWMLPYIVMIGVTVILMSTLHARKYFFVPAITPIVLNISIILCALFLSKRIDPPVLSLAAGVLIGGVIQMLIQLVTAIKKGFRYKYKLKLKLKYISCLNYQDSHLKKVFSHSTYAIWGLAAAEINIIVSMQLASFLPKGSISFLYYSNRIAQFPVGIFGAAAGIAVLPVLCDHAIKKNTKELIETFKIGMYLVIFFVLPAAIGLVVLRKPIILVLFKRGAFSYADVISTSNALAGYTLGLCFFSALKVIIPVFHSLGDYKTPVRAASFGVASNFLIGIILMFPMKHLGLALSNSFSGALNFIILIIALKKELGDICTESIAFEFMKSLAASLLMGIMLVWCGWGEAGGLLPLLGAITSGFIFYTACAFCLNCETIHIITNLVKKSA